MSKLSRKDKSKIICNHLFKDDLCNKSQETYVIMSVWDALKEIEKKELSFEGDSNVK